MGTVKKIDFRGRKRSFASLANEYGMKHGTLKARYDRGLRGDELVAEIQINSDKRQKINFKGEQVFMIDIAKKYGISIDTLRYRHQTGLKDEGLIKGSGLKGMIATTYYIKGNPYRMTEVERQQRIRNKIPTSEIQARLNLGMSMDEALSYGIKYVAKFGHLCYEVEGVDVFYYIPYEDIQELRDHDISMIYVSRNALIVDDISELLLETTRVYEEDIDHDSSVDIQMNEQRKREMIQEYKDIKYREEHPHLFDGTQQTHEWGDYAEYLASSYTFSCYQYSKEETNNE